MKKLYGILILFIIISCNEKNTNFPLITNKQNIKIDSLEFEKIELNLGEYECSYYGYSYVFNNQICFIDKFFCWLFAFSTDGNILYRELGQGRGPKEVVCKRISGISKLKNGDLMILGYTSDHYFFSNNFEKTNAFLMSNNKKHNIFESSDTYTTFYPNLEIKNYDNYLYYNIYSETDNFNFIDTPEKYYKNAKTLMKVNKNNGNVEKIEGNYSPFYQNNIGKYNAFVSLNYDIDSQGNIYLAYEADSVIYKYSKNSNPIKGFGYMGKNMDTHYKKLETWKNFGSQMQEERQYKGYYTSLFVSEFNDLIFRTYQKGQHSPIDGLQIYQDETLIGDVAIPPHIRINGYIAPYYYSTIITDVENEKLYIYRFKLPSNAF